MPPPVSSDQPSGAGSRSNLSARAAYNSVQDLPWDALEKIMANVWSPENPDGVVLLNVAENDLLREEVAACINSSQSAIVPGQLGYGVGPRGSPRLRRAMASFLNTKFQARAHVSEKEVLILPGVVAVLDALAWSVCNDGEGILVLKPFYTGFNPAVSTRARAVLVPASFQDVEGYQGLDDIFDSEMNRKALEKALLQATRDGITVRAVMLSNPHNPLGRCYSGECLREIARFCGRNGLHLISDEIFAMSVYDNPDAAAPVETFTSLLALELQDCIDYHLVHVAYGVGKDFGATGLRLGVLHSRNESLIAAVTSVSVFGWVPYFAQDMWANMLEDDRFLNEFLAKNRQMLAKHCSILRAFLDQNHIPYYKNVHAGVFVWVDLRSIFYGQPRQIAAANPSSVNALTPLDVDTSRDRETKLFKRFLASGVGVSPGSSFSAEDLGWFRVSFAVEEQSLRVGLQRLVQCLRVIEVDGWEDS